MPDQAATVQAPTDTASAATAKPSNVTIRNRPSRDPGTRSAVLAGLDKLADAPSDAATDTEAPKPESKPEEPKQEPKDGAEDAKPDEGQAEEKHEAEEPKEGKAEEPSKDAEAKDPETAKRLSVIQKAEKRSREQLTKEREDAKAEILKMRRQLEEEWQPRLKQAENFEQLKKRARIDPAGVLASLGLTDDDMEPAARQVYSRSKAAAADPKNRDAADRAMREREQGDSLAAMQKRIDELENGIRSRDQKAIAQREAERYIDSVSKAIGDNAPLVRAVMAKNPDKARYEFGRIALSLAERDGGEVPDPEDVIAEYERSRRTELEELGIDPATVIKAKKPEEPKKPPAKTLGSDATRSMTQTKANAAATYKEKKRELLRAMERDSLD